MMPRVVLAFSGGAESSAAMAWLAARDARVTAVIVDLGQAPDLEPVRDRALALGAERALVLDRRDAFIHDYAFKALAAGAIGPGRSPMSMALSRPVMAAALVEVARQEQADAVAYATGVDGRDLFGVLLRDLAPDLQIVPVDSDERGPHEAANLWGRSRWWIDGEGQRVDAPEPPRESRTRPALDDPARVAITFERGTPTAVNGIAMPPLDLLASLATLALAQGVGRVAAELAGDHATEIEEAPAALVLAAAHQAVAAAAPRPGRRDADLSAEYAAIIREGRWFSSTRAALDSRIEADSFFATGTATLQLHKGEITQHIS